MKHFIPPWWLPGRHFQTLWQPLFRDRPVPATRRERLLTPDQDFIDMDWFEPCPEGPLVVLLHGLSGSSRSPYIRGMQVALAAKGFRTVALNFRGCSGEPNHSALGYHSGETSDLSFLIQQLRRREPQTPFLAIGYSLGGNVLLKWLGETGSTADIEAAVAVSVPLRLDLCATHLDQGWSRVYRNRLLQELKEYVAGKLARLEVLGLEEEAQKLRALGDLRPIKTFWDYDARVVGGLYGFESAQAYYDASSSRRYLLGIRRPTRIVHALDDPFMTPEVLPEAHELSPLVEMVLSDSGGHVGFVDGGFPWSPGYWLERMVPDYFRRVLSPSTPTLAPQSLPDPGVHQSPLV